MSKINTRRVCDTQKMTYFTKKMAKIATHTYTLARVCAYLTLRYKNPKDFYTQIPKGFVLRYVGAGRKPKADDRAIRRKKTLRYTNPKGLCTGPEGSGLRSVT